jgi:hypothetical protein
VKVFGGVPDWRMLVQTSSRNALMFFQEDQELAELHGVYIQVKLLARSHYDATARRSEIRMTPHVLPRIESTALDADSAISSST